MTSYTKTTLFKPSAPRAETPMDKTTRIVRDIQKEEMAKAEIKTTRLRKARLEREANTVEAMAATDDAKRKKSRARKAS